MPRTREELVLVERPHRHLRGLGPAGHDAALARGTCGGALSTAMEPRSYATTAATADTCGSKAFAATQSPWLCYSSNAALIAAFSQQLRDIWCANDSLRKLD